MWRRYRTNLGYLNPASVTYITSTNSQSCSASLLYLMKRYISSDNISKTHTNMKMTVGAADDGTAQKISGHLLIMDQIPQKIRFLDNKVYS